MPIPQKPDIKATLNAATARLIARLRASSRQDRVIAVAPFVAALAMAGIVLLLAIFYRGAGTDGWGLTLLVNTGLLTFFFAPLTYVGVRLSRLIRPRLRERRFMDAICVGLYLPHVFAVLVILIARLEGSENIASLGAALITWAMLSLLLTPFSVLLTLLAWSFLPEDEKLSELRARTVKIGVNAKNMLPAPGRFNARGENLLAGPKTTASEHQDDTDAIRT